MFEQTVVGFFHDLSLRLSALPDEQLFGVFAATLAASTLIPMSLLYLAKSAKIKKICWVLADILGTVIMIYFVSFMGFAESHYQFIVGSLIFIGLFNILFVDFCKDCGKYMQSANPIARPKVCTECAQKNSCRP